MIPTAWHPALVWTEIALAGVTFASLLFIAAPYGRHARSGWGPAVPAPLGWLLMESPASIGFLWIYLAGPDRGKAASLALMSLWIAHYAHRTFIYPLRLPKGTKPMPLSIALMGFSFNVLNAWINATWIAGLGAYGDGWLGDPRFLAGAAIFAAGFAVNFHSDAILLRLRAEGGGRYRIPSGGLFRFVSSPNYLGEILEWCGWAVATWSLAGTAFALYTAANLVPRALTHHRWYRERFPDYPAGRRAIVPGVL